MSDFERGKYYGKKRYNAQRAERVDTNSAFSSRFFNNKTVYNPDKDTKDSEDDTKPKVKQPQILIKTREKTEERSVSPKHNAKESDAKDITVAGNSASESQNPPMLKYMTKSMKLLDDGIIFGENIADYLQECADFVVCGVIGSQGVGKSTIMNLLASKDTNETIKKSFKKEDVDTDDDGIKLLTENLFNLNMQEKVSEHIFKQASNIENVESCSSTTSGIDIYITDNRVILLDCQPFLSISVFDELIRSELKRSNIISEFLPLENSGEIQGLQHIAFLMTVCHVLIFVQDYFFDSNNIRFLQTAEMLKPTIAHTEELYTDHFPNLVVLHNKAQMEDFSPNRFKTIQQMYKKMFSASNLITESSMGLGTGRIINGLNSELCEGGKAFNLFLLPEYNTKTDEMYRGHPPFEDLVKRLKNNIIAATKGSITHVELTEKTWLAYCVKVWDNVKKSSFYVEYTKLMP